MTIEEILKHVESDARAYDMSGVGAINSIRHLLSEHPNPAQSRVAELEAKLMAKTLPDWARIRESMNEKPQPGRFAIAWATHIQDWFKVTSIDVAMHPEIYVRWHYLAPAPEPTQPLDSAASQSGGKETI